MTQELRAIVAEMQNIRNKQSDLNDEESILWRRFFEIADDFVGEGESFRFVDTTKEIFMAREMHQFSPRLNVDKLSYELSDSDWILISEVERVFKIEKLEAAVALGQISKEIVERNTERPAATPHKKFGGATKKDLDLQAALDDGIVV